MRIGTAHDTNVYLFCCCIATPVTRATTIARVLLLVAEESRSAIYSHAPMDIHGQVVKSFILRSIICKCDSRVSWQGVMVIEVSS